MEEAANVDSFNDFSTFRYKVSFCGRLSLHVSVRGYNHKIHLRYNSITIMQIFFFVARTQSYPILL